MSAVEHCQGARWRPIFSFQIKHVVYSFILGSKNAFKQGGKSHLICNCACWVDVGDLLILVLFPLLLLESMCTECSVKYLSLVSSLSYESATTILSHRSPVLPSNERCRFYYCLSQQRFRSQFPRAYRRIPEHEGELPHRRSADLEIYKG